LAEATLTITELLNKIQQFVYISESADWIENTMIVLESNRNKLQYNNTLEHLIEEILKKTALFNDASKLISIMDTKLQFSERLNKLDRLIPLIESVTKVSEYISLTGKLSNYRLDLDLVKENEANLSEEYHLMVCPDCSGNGVVHF
jgi:hypothetical protein